MLVNPLEYIKAARQAGWAIGGFNVYNLESARAVIAAATNTKAPVMVQTSEGAVKHAGFGNIASIVRQLADAARDAIEAGYTSVMINTSRLPLEENIAATHEIAEYAHARDVLMTLVEEAIRLVVEGRIRLFGSAGKAA